MKQLSSFVKKTTKKIESANSVGFLDESQLKNYLNTVKDLLSDEAINVINWLITNNKTYVKDLGGTETDSETKNILADFYNAGKPSDEKLKVLWDYINELVSKDRVLEIPVFQSKNDFNKIINKELPLDYVVLRLDTPDGKEEIVNKYNRLIEKIIHQWDGKSNFSHDELRSVAYEATTYAINNFGKRGKRGKADDDSYINKTFGQYLAYQIRCLILEEIKNLSHTVRIPVAQQRKEKQSKGTNTRNYTVSGDKIIKKGKDGDGNKSIFDFIGVPDVGSSSNLDNEDMDKLWKAALKQLENKFSKLNMDIFYSFFGINGYKKLKNKELSAKYGVVPSQITYYIHKIISYIKTDPKIKKMFGEINDLMHECMNEREKEDDETYSINIKENSEDEME